MNDHFEINNNDSAMVPFLVTSKGMDLFRVEKNGDIILRGEKIGNDKELADLFIQHGKIMSGLTA